MSIVVSNVVRRLYDDAQIYDERATTRLWEYVLSGPFRGPEWIRASQQPPTWRTYDDRRVDLIIEHMKLDAGPPSRVLFVEAKRHAAEESIIRGCEAQGWDAAHKCSLYEGEGPLWYMSCIGTRARIWIYDPQQELPIAFLPGIRDLEDVDDYLDISVYGDQLMLACEYIAKNHVPPAKYLVQQSPPMSSPGNSSEPMSSPTSDARLATRIKASAEIPIPLSEEHWQFVTILHNDGSNVSWRTAGGQQFTTPVDAWRGQLKSYGDTTHPCFAYIQSDTQIVYYSWELKPDPPSTQTQQEPGSSGFTAGSSTNPGAKAAGDWLLVKVTTRKHLTQPDEFIFVDAHGSQRYTSKKDWTEDRYNGRKVMVYRTKKRTYVMK